MGFDDYKVVLYRQDDGSWVAEIPTRLSSVGSQFGVAGD
jgi:hypothetical protein